MNAMYEIKTLKPAPMMTQDSVFFVGTYQQAVDIARMIFSAAKRPTSVHTTRSTTAWFVIKGDGQEVDNNTNSDVVLNNK